jgi:hypothetical protein
VVCIKRASEVLAANPARRRVAPHDAAPLGQDENRRLSVSEQEKIEIVGQVAPSKEGNYQRTDEHGRDIRGDASGEWALDENGDVEDIVFFLSPGAARRWSE